MVTPPHITNERLADLVAFAGGAAPAAKAIGVSIACLRQWLAEGNAPDWAGRLLWFHTPAGREAVAADVAAGLQYVAGERDALRAELSRKEQLIDQAKASLAGRVKALETENKRLRELLSADVVIDQLAQAQGVLNRLMRSLGSTNERQEPSQLASEAEAANASVAGDFPKRA